MSRPPSVANAVLITGAAGYIGSLVTRALAENPQGLRRIVATDVREPAPDARASGVTYLTLDVRAPELRDVIVSHGIDTVVHLAAIVTPAPGQTREFQYSVDVEGTRNVLDACVAGEVRKVIITSSGAAYGYHADNYRMLDEDSPLRGNVEFAYSDHKRIVEELLAEYRERHPALGQLVFRVGTILGESVKNQITALFEKPVVLGLSGAPAPFVFIWDRDVVAAIEAGIHGPGTGIYNLAGDGTMTLREIARKLGKPYVSLPTEWVAGALGVLKRLGLSQYGPEQVGFLRYRPVLANDRLKREFGYTPARTSREVFDLYRNSVASAGR
ncbi:MAG: SDR family oxidoreductase [bacterium]